jgi:hypothetical protein
MRTEYHYTEWVVHCQAWRGFFLRDAVISQRGHPLLLHDVHQGLKAGTKPRVAYPYLKDSVFELNLRCFRLPLLVFGTAVIALGSTPSTAAQYRFNSSGSWSAWYWKR